MKEYFLLQFTMVNRRLGDFKVPLLVAYAIVPIAFLLLSIYLFAKTDYAVYLYILTAVSLISRLSEQKRNDFLKTVFNRRKYLALRVVENLACSAPFLIFMAFKGFLLPPLALALLTISMACFRFNMNTNSAIPTPFGKKPFEFAVGFRRTFYIFPIAYCLSFVSIFVGNFNLGVFSMILVGLVCLSYYSKPEKEYFVWIFKTTSKLFLLEKIKVSFAFFTLLVLPIVVALLVFFFENVWIVLGALLLGYVYLATIILAKYSAYPNEMNLPQGVLIAISLLFPPILVGIIPLFYAQSVRNLNLILNDSN